MKRIDRIQIAKRGRSNKTTWYRWTCGNCGLVVEHPDWYWRERKRVDHQRYCK